MGETNSDPHCLSLQTSLAGDLLGKASKGHPVVDVHGERHIWVIIFKNEEDHETWEMEAEDQVLTCVRAASLFHPFSSICTIFRRLCAKLY